MQVAILITTLMIITILIMSSAEEGEGEAISQAILKLPTGGRGHGGSRDTPTEKFGDNLSSPFLSSSYHFLCNTPTIQTTFGNTQTKYKTPNRPQTLAKIQPSKQKGNCLTTSSNLQPKQIKLQFVLFY